MDWPPGGYTYDQLSRLQKVSQDGVTIAEYSYDVNGNRKSLSYPQNGGSVFYQYNYTNLITQLINRKGNTIQSSFSYTYDLDGNQTSKTSNGKTTRYSYDLIGRLTNESVSDGNAIAYEYDGYGNRSKMSVSGQENYEVTYEYHINNWLLKEEKRQGNTLEITQYQYDGNGNQCYRQWEKLEERDRGQETPRVGFPGEEFKLEETVLDLREYDGFNQLLWVFRDGKEVTYRYRPDGLRHTKTLDGSTTTHLWDGQNLVAELSHNGSTKSRYLRGIGLVAQQIDGNTHYYFHNAHGDVVQQVDTKGTVLHSYDYDAFGVEQNPNPLDPNPFRYCGEYYEKSSGEYYLRSRYYNPATGRFTQEDPITNGLNWYTYCVNDPVNRADPLGLVSCYFYDPYDASNLEKTMLGAQELADYYGTSTYLVPFTKATFRDHWNNMGVINGNSVDIDSVAILAHGGSRGLGVWLDKSTYEVVWSINDLANTSASTGYKNHNIDMFLTFACQVNDFAEKLSYHHTNIDKVVASTGSVISKVGPVAELNTVDLKTFFENLDEITTVLNKKVTSQNVHYFKSVVETGNPPQKTLGGGFHVYTNQNNTTLKEFLGYEFYGINDYNKNNKWLLIWTVNCYCQVKIPGLWPTKFPSFSSDDRSLQR